MAECKIIYMELIVPYIEIVADTSIREVSVKLDSLPRHAITQRSRPAYTCQPHVEFSLTTVNKEKMKKFLFLPFFFLSFWSFGQPGRGQVDFTKIPEPAYHYQEEFTFDSSLNPEAWNRITKGLHVSFVSTDEAWFRSEVPQLQSERVQWSATGWKGERLNAEILIWSSDTVNQLRFILNNLTNAKGDVLTKDHMELSKVSYVLSNYPYNSPDASCGGGPVDKAFLLPDRLSSLNRGNTDRFDLPGKTARPVWLSVDLPRETPAGTYRGVILLQSENGSMELPLSIRVQDQVLPAPHNWNFRLDLWQNPWVIAEYYHVQPWGKEHMDLLKKHLKPYADAGGTFITTYGVHSPWGDNEYTLEGGMIEWIKLKDGKWKFDYSIFDKYVSLCMGLGIDRAITIYTPLPWGERFRYKDAATGNYVYERWVPASDTFRTNWNIFLTDLRRHLEQKHWFSKTYLGVNENAMEQTLSAIQVIKEHSRDWKITYAGDWHTELDTLLDDYSSVFGKEPGVAETDNRSMHGRTSSFYICCTPPKPNTFVFSPPIEGRWLGWYSFAHHYDGFLRWAYDAWPQDPLRDARFGSWAAGDCFLVYPGGQSSIRFEKLREGIVDYEKLLLLTEKLKGSKDREVKKLLTQLEQLKSSFVSEKEFDTKKITGDVAKGKMIVEQLTDALTRIK
jgi:hypothetical protein